jgi:hypothetical protein
VTSATSDASQPGRPLCPAAGPFPSEEPMKAVGKFGFENGPVTARSVTWRRGPP